MVKHSADLGEELNKMSQQTGISVENLSGLRYAAKLSETDLDTLNRSVGIFSKSLWTMNDEGKDTTKILNSIGVTSKDSYEALLQVADAFAKMENGFGKLAIARDLFGKKGADLIPLLNEGADGIKRMYTEAEKMGAIMSGPGARTWMIQR
jgi:hypothetical protein